MGADKELLLAASGPGGFEILYFPLIHSLSHTHAGPCTHKNRAEQPERKTAELYYISFTNNAKLQRQKSLHRKKRKQKKDQKECTQFCRFFLHIIVMFLSLQKEEIHTHKLTKPPSGFHFCFFAKREKSHNKLSFYAQEFLCSWAPSSPPSPQGNL